jgi:hypothetical protein
MGFILGRVATRHDHSLGHVSHHPFRTSRQGHNCTAHGSPRTTIPKSDDIDEEGLVLAVVQWSDVCIFRWCHVTTPTLAKQGGRPRLYDPKSFVVRPAMAKIPTEPVCTRSNNKNPTPQLSHAPTESVRRPGNDIVLFRHCATYMRRRTKAKLRLAIARAKYLNVWSVLDCRLRVLRCRLQYDTLEHAP